MVAPHPLFFYFMGLTKSFFTKPIEVNLTFRETVNGETVDYPITLIFNRETVGQRNDLTVAASLFSETDNFDRFCKQLACEPKGIDDFPKGKKPLEERAREYFAGEGYKDLIAIAVMEVERAQKPLEFFRSF